MSRMSDIMEMVKQGYSVKEIKEVFELGKEIETEETQKEETDPAGGIQEQDPGPDPEQDSPAEDPHQEKGHRPHCGSDERDRARPTEPLQGNIDRRYRKNRH